MSFQVSALDAAPFAHLFGQSDAALATRGARAYVVDRSPGSPAASVSRTHRLASG